MINIAHKRIYITGFMGSGKTNIGKKIACKLGYDFIDLDNYIESKLCKTIQEIFTIEGEGKFRIYENQYLIGLSNFENVVISCGGGTPCYNDNITLMNNTGLTIYLKHDITTLAHRLLNSKKKNSRPLVLNKTYDELITFISALLPIREKYYNLSKIIFETKNNTLAQLINIVNSYK